MKPVITIIQSFPILTPHIVQKLEVEGGVPMSTQVTLEDSGNPLATLSGFGINDEECQVATKHDLNPCQRDNLHRWAFAPSARWRPAWGGSLSEASVNSPCLTGGFWTMFESCLNPPEFTTTSSTRKGNQCISAAEPQFYFTTRPFLLGFGES